MTVPAAASMGWAGALAMDPTSTFSGSSELYEYTAISLKATKEIVDTNGTRGTRSHATERTRAGVIACGGTVTMNPTTSQLRLLLPRIMGDDEAGSGPYTYALKDTLPTFSCLQKLVAKDMQYDGCVVNKATFRAKQGEKLELELDIQGQTYTTQNAGTLVALALTETTDPFFMFYDATISIESTAYTFFDFELTIDNACMLDRYLNSQTRTQIIPADRTVTLKITEPFTSDYTALYDSITNKAVVLTLTNGSHVVAFTMAGVRFPFSSADVDGKNEIKFPLEGTARMSSTTKELTASITV